MGYFVSLGFEYLVIFSRSELHCMVRNGFLLANARVNCAAAIVYSFHHFSIVRERMSLL